MRLRVVQWTTGFVGRSAVRAILSHPHLELVGCYSWTAEKSGVDVGTLCGIEPVGVTTTHDVDALIALRPDAVLYMPLHWDVDHMVRLLESGINIVSTANFITGRSYGDAEMERLIAAAERGGASLHGTGTNPGLANALGLMVTAVCSRVDRISVLESVDATPYASPQSWREVGFGFPPETPGLAEMAKSRQLVFIDAVEMMADALGITVDSIEYTPEFGVATEDLDLGYMKIDKGTVCGLKGTWSGILGGRAVIELGLMWRLGYAMEPDWPSEGGYVIEVDGAPSARARFEILAHDDLGLATANPAVNVIPDVVAAAPGLVTADQLPLPTAAWRAAP